LRPGVVCVSAEVDVRVLAGIVSETARTTLFVVDDERRLLGLVRAPVRWPPHGTASAMMTEASGVLESTPVRRALVEMAVAHWREAPIVTSSAELVGTLGDLEGMRWLTANRRPVR
jgi:hypothetical protein